MANNFNATTVRTLMLHTLEQIKTNAAQQMDVLDRNASMRSIRSLQSIIVDDTRAQLWGLPSWSGRNGNVIMERGRRRGAIPSGFTGIIRQWILDKGLPVRTIPAKTPRGDMGGIDPYERGLRSMAGAIAYTIKMKGTRLNRRGGFDDIITTQSQVATEQLADKLIWFLDETVLEILGKQTRF